MKKEISSSGTYVRLMKPTRVPSRVGSLDVELAGQAVLARALHDTRLDEVARHVLDARRDQRRGLQRQHVSASGACPLAEACWSA